MRARREKPPVGKAKTRADGDRRETASRRRRSSDRAGGDRSHRDERTTARRSADSQPRKARAPRAREIEAARGKRPAGAGPQTAPMRRVSPATSTSQAKARAKARKAKAPKAVRPPLRDRLAAKVASIDLRPRTLAAKVPFVVLVIGSLGAGLAVTLWLSTDAAERSYELGSAREKNRVLSQQKEALERDVLQAQSAPALAEAARNLGMIPSKDTAHLVQDPAGNWVVVGEPKPADGVPPPPLNTRLPDPTPPRPKVDPREVPVRMPAPGTPATGLSTPHRGNPEVPVGPPLAGTAHAPTGAASPGPGPAAPPPAAPAPFDAPPPANPPNPPVGPAQFTDVASPTPAPPT